MAYHRVIRMTIKNDEQVSALSDLQVGYAACPNCGGLTNSHDHDILNYSTHPVIKLMVSYFQCGSCNCEWYIEKSALDTTAALVE